MPYAMYYKDPSICMLYHKVEYIHLNHRVTMPYAMCYNASIRMPCLKVENIHLSHRVSSHMLCITRIHLHAISQCRVYSLEPQGNDAI